MESSILIKEKENMIISTSGWRKLFANSIESKSSSVSKENILLCKSIALAFCKAIKPKQAILIGTDTRPTSANIAKYCYSVFKSLGVEFRYVGPIATPEILSESIYSKYAAFFYISASHNPIGYNGFKFGNDGALFNAEDNIPIIKNFELIIRNQEELDKLDMIEIIKAPIDTDLKEDTILHYALFMQKIVNVTSFKKNFGIVIDFNGSARTTSIDQKLLHSLKVKVIAINNKPGEIVHAILPEAENLNYAQDLLQKAYDKDSAYFLGYMPDCDGDRGNLVYINNKGKAEKLTAQAVFALTVYAKLSTSDTDTVVCNGPTSRRIEDICSQFNAKCYRSEVGEANVIQLSKKLEQAGNKVGITGEGSNGGCIIPPSQVRDPLSTVLSLLKMLENSKDNLTQIIAKLPNYITTDAFSEKANIKLVNKDFLSVKKHFLNNFEKAWPIIKEKTGFDSYSIFQTLGIEEKETKIISTSKGGFKLLFYKDKNPIAFMWFRPSGTEPLLRMLIDVKGNKRELHNYLLNLERDILSIC